jgi:hypothetical protein
LPSQFCSCLKQKLQFQLCCLRQMPLDAPMVVSPLKSSSLPIQEASLFCSLCWVHFSSSPEACCDLNEHTLDFFHSFVLGVATNSACRFSIILHPKFSVIHYAYLLHPYVRLSLSLILLVLHFRSPLLCFLFFPVLESLSGSLSDFKEKF